MGGESWGEDGFFRVTTGRECMGLGTVVDVCQPAPVADGEPITPPPPSTPNPTTTVSTTTAVSTTTGSTTVSTTTNPVTTTTAISTTEPFNPCSNPSKYCQWACAKGWPFFINRLC